MATPEVLIAQQPQKKYRFKFTLPNKKISLIILVIIIIMVAVTGAIFLKNYKSQVTTVKPKVQLTAKQDLEQTIKQTFTDAKDQDIIRYISFASNDRTLETKFIDYSKAYQLIYQRYQTSATITIKKALIKLRVFLKAFPQYKEADFKLPK